MQTTYFSNKAPEYRLQPDFPPEGPSALFERPLSCAMDERQTLYNDEMEHKASILVVDDEPRLLESVRQMLEAASMPGLSPCTPMNENQ